MRVLKRTGLLVIVLLAALFTSFAITGNIANAEEPPKISDHVYDPGDKLGSQADKVKERLASLDRSGLHVYVAFPSEYSNDTVSNWNLMALQKSGAPQGSYMLSIVADNPNQTMYLASADNAAKLSQEELSAIASEKMVPLLNQQKYPEAVLAYLDALSAKAPEMGSGMAVAPWAMIAFLIALIVVIIVISRVLRARRQAQDRIEEKTKDEAALEESASPVSAALATGSSATPDSETLVSEEEPILAPAKEDKRSDEEEKPTKGKFRLRFKRKEKPKAKSKSRQKQVDKPDFAPTGLESLETAATSAPAPEAPTATARPATPAATPGLAGVQTPKADLPDIVPATPTGIPDGSPAPAAGGKVPSLAELDQIALARSSSHATASTVASPAHQVPAPSSQPQPGAPVPPSQPAAFSPQPQPQPQTLPQTPAQPVSEAQLAQPVSGAQPAQPIQPAQPEQPVSVPQPQQPAPLRTPKPAAFSPQPQSSPVGIPAQAPAVSPLAKTADTATTASSPAQPATVSTSEPRGHSSVLRPGQTTYLPPQANDDDTQVTSAARIKEYGQERRDEIARARARAHAADRFREEQAKRQATATPSVSTPAPAIPNAATTDAGARATGAPAEQQRTASPTLPQMAPAVDNLNKYSLPPISPQAIPQVPGQVSPGTARPVSSPLTRQEPPSVAPSVRQAPAQEQPQPAYSPAPVSPAPSQLPSREPVPSQLAAQTVPEARVVDKTPTAPPETAQREEPQPQPDFTKILRQADSWARKGASKLALAQQRVGKTVTQPFALALVRAQDSVRAAFAEFATAQLQSRPIDQQIVAGNLPEPLRELRDQITHFTNLYHQQTPLNEIIARFEREIVSCREELVRCRLIVERIQKVEPQKAARIGGDVMGAHKLLSRAQNLIEDAKTMDRGGQENEVLKATVRTENLLLQARKIVRQARAEEAALQAAAKVEAALTFAEKVEPLSEQVAILMAAVDDYIGVHTAKVGIAARTMLDLANRTLTRLDRPGSLDTQEALRLLQRAQQQTEQALRLAENDVAKRS